jgi:predicted RNase H-like nuclease (RuvC/YqgF family)
MDEPQRSTVMHLDQSTDPAPEGRRTQEQAQPQRLLGELSRASQSLAEMLDSLTAEKRELEARAAQLEREVERLRTEAATARNEAVSQIRRAEEETERNRLTAAREAARYLGRAERAERLLAVLGGEQETGTFCISVGRFSRRRASRELLEQAAKHGLQLQLSAEHGWFSSLLVAEVEGDPEQLRMYRAWVADRFPDSFVPEIQS